METKAEIQRRVNHALFKRRHYLATGTAEGAYMAALNWKLAVALCARFKATTRNHWKVEVQP